MIDAPLTEMAGELRVLSRPERVAANNWRRTAQVWMHAGLGRFMTSTSTFDRMFGRALASPTEAGHRPFAVPLPYALGALGHRLRVELPTALLACRLADWVGQGGRAYHVSDYFVGFGNWGPIAFPFAQTGVMREALELMQTDLDYRRTRCFGIYRERLEAGNPVRRNKVLLASEALLESYFERYVALFRSIRAHGVVSIAEGASPSGLSKANAVRPVRAVLGERDIGVAIGAAGEIYALPGGKHRAAIATVLGIRTVPAEVRLVHAEWIRAIGTPRKTSPSAAIALAIDGLGDHARPPAPAG